MKVYIIYKQNKTIKQLQKKNIKMDPHVNDPTHKPIIKQVHRYKLPNGSTYTGQLIDNKFDGQGILKYANDQRYEGTFSKGLKHGKGKYYYKNGQFYIGDWQNNKKQGNGIYFYESNKRYQGEFRDNMKHGHGKIYEDNGNIYQGQFYQNLQHNKGVYYDCANNKTVQFVFDHGVQVQCRDLNQTPAIQSQRNLVKSKSNDVLSFLAVKAGRQARQNAQIVSDSDVFTYTSLIPTQSATNNSNTQQSTQRKTYGIPDHQVRKQQQQSTAPIAKELKPKKQEKQYIQINLQVIQWSVDDVCEWLQQIQFADFVTDFRNGSVNGLALLYLSQGDFMELNIVNQNDRVLIRKQIQLLVLMLKKQCLSDVVCRKQFRENREDLTSSMMRNIVRQQNKPNKNLENIMQQNRDIRRRLVRHRKQIIKKDQQKRKYKTSSTQKHHKSDNETSSSSSSSETSSTSSSSDQLKKNRNNKEVVKKMEKIKLEDKIKFKKFISQQNKQKDVQNKIQHDQKNVKPKQQKQKRRIKRINIQKKIYDEMAKKHIDVNDIIPREQVQLIKLIGRGSYGQVFLATLIGQEVAVKRYKKKKGFRNRHIAHFLEQAEITYKLLHPNIVLYMGMFIHDNQFAMIMEYLPGGSLFDYIHVKGNRLTQQHIYRVCRDIACGMAYLHSKDIIHCDLKSSNLLLNKNMKIKIADFGLARIISEPQHKYRHKKQVRFGTPQWMAPEIMQGKNYDKSSDIYSFGIILWELMTNEIPHHQKLTVQSTIENEDIQIPTPEYGDRFLIQLFKKCTQKQQKNRPTFLQISKRIQQKLQDHKSSCLNHLHK